MERLLDIRFLSADFLNTFLITYRVFTSATALLDTLLQFYYSHNAKDYPLYLAPDVFSPVSRKVRSVSLPTESLSPRHDKKKANSMLTVLPSSSILCPVQSTLVIADTLGT